MTELVAVDVGGTHARFAMARIAGGRVTSLDEVCTLDTADHENFESAWKGFGARLGRPLPRAAGIALAAPIKGEALKLTNNRWVIRPAALPHSLGVDHLTLVNDFDAVAHAVAGLDDSHFAHVCGDDRPLPAEGAISIVGPGTGLGVALLLRRSGQSHVIATEGGHIGFAPTDPLEDRLLHDLRQRYGRVSAERLVSGQGLPHIYRMLAAEESADVPLRDQKALWTAALAGGDRLAAAALNRFCEALGSVAGDIALTQGAAAVVIAGGLGLRLASHLPKSGFHSRFTAKGRYQRMMQEMPVKLITHPQPGLFGAAAAFGQAHTD